MRKFAFTLVALGLSTGALAQRLPATVVPTHYALWFAPDLQNATFRGRETIDITVANPTTTITLNAAEIQFGAVTIMAGGRMQTARVALDDRSEMATLTVPRALPKGTASIQITYTGILNDKLRGFYLSKANGRRYAVTQMEATDARRAFPSWDEPAYKATFDVSLMIDAGDTAISNGAQVSDTPGRSRARTRWSSRARRRCRATWSRCWSATSSAAAERPTRLPFASAPRPTSCRSPGSRSKRRSRK